MSAHPRRGGFLARRRACVAGLAAFALAAATLGASAQQAAPAFPGKIIRIIPFGTAGGPIDVIARLFADKLRQRWG
jgi:tripartite-type tricarboxylate transporter receptor subunit TctC